MELFTILINRIRNNWRFEFNLILGSIAVIIFYLIRLELAGNPLALVNDNYSLGYPWRILVSTSMQNGIFPLWDHWTHGGMPFHSPLTMLSFSPIVQLLSLFGIYSLSTFVIEILIIHVLCFIGMYVWLTFYSSKLSSIVIAFCFTITGLQIIITPLNIDSVVSTALLPWAAVGMKYCMRSSLKGIGILALAIWIMMTTGYLGMNVIYLEFIVFYGISEMLIYILIKKYTITQLFSGIFYMICGFLLGGLIVNYPFIENFVYYGTAFATMRDSTFSPYASSANLFSLFTLFFPNKINAFVGDKFMAHTGMMFFGSIPIYMAIYSFFYKKFRYQVILLMLFFIVSFVATLSMKYSFAYWISWNFPLLRYIRWHVWFLTISVFFLATAASMGLNKFLEEIRKGRKLLAYGIFIGLSVLVAVKQSGIFYTSPTSYLFYPQILAYISLGAIIVASFEKTKKLTYPLHVCTLIVVEVCVVSFSIPLFGNNLGLVKDEVAIRETEKIQSKAFPEISNQRTPEKNNINPQYYTKQPALYGYSPVIHPILATFINSSEYPIIMKDLFYPVQHTGYPDTSGESDIRSIRLTPNSAEAVITVQSDQKDMVWSSPYSPFWKLTVDGKPSLTIPNGFGLTQFSLSKGIHSVQFKYMPPYFVPSMILAFMSICISTYLIIRKPGNGMKKRGEKRGI